MKKIHIAILLLLALSACATRPSPQILDNLWYAEKEQHGWVPNYHSYVLFQDDTHFIWWRTVDPLDVVLKRLDFYTIGGTADEPVTFTRVGDQLQGELRIPLRSKTGELVHTQIQRFTGHFNGNHLDMEFERSSMQPGAALRSEGAVQWSMTRVGSK